MLFTENKLDSANALVAKHIVSTSKRDSGNHCWTTANGATWTESEIVKLILADDSPAVAKASAVKDDKASAAQSWLAKIL